MYQNYFQMSFEIKKKRDGECCTAYGPNKERRAKERWKPIYVEIDYMLEIMLGTLQK